MIGAITSFTGEYAWLSNFYAADFEWRNTWFRSAEHAFQYAKGFAIKDLDKQEQYFTSILNAPDPGTAKRLGQKVSISLAHWENNKVWYMREIVHAKFAGVQGLPGKLINTGAKMLVEGNTWGDSFWGRIKENGKWKGYNVLGVILMEERGCWLRSLPPWTL